MKRWADLLASFGEFTDASGERAKRWIRVGCIMRDQDSGRMSVKIDAVPIDPSWSGWLAVRNVDGHPADLEEPTAEELGELEGSRCPGGAAGARGGDGAARG